MAKALGNGMPIGACWARHDVAEAFGPGDHATTFGGQPLAAAAARAVLAVMEAEDVPTRARAAGAYLTAAIEPLPSVAAVEKEPARLRPRPSMPVWLSTPSRRPLCGWPHHCW